ncbi:MAG: hypothetical protein ACTS4V_00265 [Candidatus Hodgkinia cicadicola]
MLISFERLKSSFVAFGLFSSFKGKRNLKQQTSDGNLVKIFHVSEMLIN